MKPSHYATQHAEFTYRTHGATVYTTWTDASGRTSESQTSTSSLWAFLDRYCAPALDGSAPWEVVAPPVERKNEYKVVETVVFLRRRQPMETGGLFPKSDGTWTWAWWAVERDRWVDHERLAGGNGRWDRAWALGRLSSMGWRACGEFTAWVEAGQTVQCNPAFTLLERPLYGSDGRPLVQGGGSSR